LEGSYCGLIRYSTGICLKTMRKATKNYSQDSQRPGRNSNSTPPEYESIVFLLRKLAWRMRRAIPPLHPYFGGAEEDNVELHTLYSMPDME
jgi:hypothetical protein